MRKLLSQVSIRKRKAGGAFTLMELLVVITIIAILAALILNTAGFVQRKAARARAESEVKALEAALESYKADMGDYPVTNNGSPLTTNTATALTANSFLIDALMPGASNTLNPLKKVYFEFNKSMMTTNGSGTNVTDPFGDPYGYYYVSSNSVNTGLKNGAGFFDLWSRAATGNSNQWITNW